MAILPTVETRRQRSADETWVEVDPKGPYFLAGGERWFPSGWCCARPDVLTPEDLRRMADAGCNALRLWPDHNETGVLPANLATLVREAAALGIRCSVTMLNLGELSDAFIPSPNLKRVPNAYRDLCETPQELLTRPEAVALSRQRIDGYLDVLGDDPNVFSWVVISQIDGVYQVPLGVLDGFVAEMARYVGEQERRRFGVRRPRAATSLDPLPIWRSAYASPQLEVVGLHCYSPSIYSPVDGLQAAWEVARTTVEACRRRPPGRPVHCLEYGSILHLFLPDHPTLPADLLRRWRRNTAAAHLCAGGAGGPLLVPPVPSDTGADPGGHGGGAVTGLADQVRPIPRTIPAELEAGERAFRQVLGDPVLQVLGGEPLPLRAPERTLAVACGGDNGAALVWVAADTRLWERRELVRRALERDPTVSPLLGYDAGRALLEAYGQPLWNPGSRLMIGKLLEKGLAEVAAERVAAELNKVASLIRQVDLPAAPASLGGTRLELPGSHRPRRWRCYDLQRGAVVASGTIRGELVLPELPEAVVAVNPA